MITLTTAAAKKAYELICADENFNLSLRVYIIGGGCSGFQYGFAFEDLTTIEDGEYYTVITKDIVDNNGVEATVKLIVDPMSLNYLGGAEVDYEESLQGSRFIVRNPNAKTTCGCGSSFTI